MPLSDCRGLAPLSGLFIPAVVSWETSKIWSLIKIKSNVQFICITISSFYLSIVLINGLYLHHILLNEKKIDDKVDYWYWNKNKISVSNTP